MLVVFVYRPSEHSKSSNLWDDVVFVRFRSGDKVMSLGGSGVDGTVPTAKNSWHMMFPLRHAVLGGMDFHISLSHTLSETSEISVVIP